MSDCIDAERTAPNTMHHQAVSLGIQMSLERVKTDGDLQDFARLYAWTAAWIGAGRPVPEPVGAFIAERMKEVASALSAKDVRAELVKAVAPHPKNNRPQGARRARIDRLALIAQVVEDLLHVDGSRGRRKSLVAAMSKQYGYAEESIDRAITKLRGSNPK